jgi:hypothetical protein
MDLGMCVDWRRGGFIILNGALREYRKKIEL